MGSEAGFEEAIVADFAAAVVEVVVAEVALIGMEVASIVATVAWASTVVHRTAHLLDLEAEAASAATASMAVVAAIGAVADLEVTETSVRLHATTTTAHHEVGDTVTEMQAVAAATTPARSGRTMAEVGTMSRGRADATDLSSHAA